MDIETEKRRDRYRQQDERETMHHQREQQGLKGHYLVVDGRGIPYSFGVGAWQQELNRLSASLDPSVMNIRFQPKEAMATLRHSLKEHFDYAAPIDRAYIKKLVGKSVMQRRLRLLKSMAERDSCPPGLDKDIWEQLDQIWQDPRRALLSERMKYANAAKVHKGRTSSKGEEGIKEDLHCLLGRDPNPEEVHYEMQWKKEYTGVAQPRKERKKREFLPLLSMGKRKAGEDMEDGSHEGIELQHCSTQSNKRSQEYSLIYI